MKNILFKFSIWIIAVFFNLPASGQIRSFHDQFIYRMIYQKDSSDIQSMETEMMELIMSDSLTVFQSVKIGQKDSIEKYGEMIYKSFKISPQQTANLRTMVKYSIYKYDNDSVLFKENFTYLPTNESNTKFYVDVPEFNWMLSSDTLTINGLMCQKASLNYQGRWWTAWFATEIPISEGPYKFKGLPGLIVKIIDDTETWLFDLFQIKSINRMVYLPDDKNIKKHTLSKSEFYKSRRYHIENETIIKEGNGHIAFTDKTARQKMVDRDKSKSKKDNNWIELYP